ncbi:MAG: hypothetical protein QGD92_15600, partial [Gammaproteobacteria bacterium]|nr:hypothetical protein [Gammaproteobacteria bacterium]
LEWISFARIFKDWIAGVKLMPLSRQCCQRADKTQELRVKRMKIGSLNRVSPRMQKYPQPEILGLMSGK